MDHNEIGLVPAGRQVDRRASRRTAHVISIPSGLVLELLGVSQELRATSATIRDSFPGNAAYLDTVSAKLQAIAEQANS